MTLEARDQLVLELLSDGYTIAAIAEKMELSVGKIETCVADLRVQLGARNAAQLVAEAIRRGVIQ